MAKRFVKPTPQEVAEYAQTIDYDIDGDAFCDFYESKGWVVGKSPMKSWQAAVRTWKRMDDKRHGAVKPTPRPVGEKSIKEKYMESQNG